MSTPKSIYTALRLSLGHILLPCTAQDKAEQAACSQILRTSADCTPLPTCPECPAMLFSKRQAAKSANGIHTPASALGRDTASTGDQWAAQQLAVDGEEVLGKVHLSQYLLLSRILLTTCLGEHIQVCWRPCLYFHLLLSVGHMTENFAESLR